MTAFKQLYDPNAATYYMIDGKAFLFKVVSDEINKQTRLKPYFSAILLALFSKHPEPVSYAMITSILQSNNITCPDETRLHRKVSELRSFLSRFCPGLNQIISNTRGIGYSLPLHFRDPELTTSLASNKISNKKFQDIILKFQDYITYSLSLSKKCDIVRSEAGFVLQRKPVHLEIEQLLEQYDKQSKKLLTELRFHPADFIIIRLEFTLAKLKTYLGLARISEFSISKEQWLEWHKHETQYVLNELIHLIKQAEQAI